MLRRQHAEAIVGLRAALRLAPRDPQLWYQLGAVLREAGHPVPAVAAFAEARNWTTVMQTNNRALANSSNASTPPALALPLAAIYLAMADAYEDSGDVAAAVDYLDKCVASEMADAAANGDGNDDDESNESKQAGGAVSRYTSDPSVLRRLGLGLLLMRNFKAAARHLRALLVLLGILRFEGGYSPRGLREAAAMPGGMAGEEAMELLHALGLCECEEQRYAAAADALRAALTVDPTHLASSLELGRCYRLSGEPERGLAPLQSLLKQVAPRVGIASGSSSAGGPGNYDAAAGLNEALHGEVATAAASQANYNGGSAARGAGVVTGPSAVPYAALYPRPLPEFNQVASRAGAAEKGGASAAAAAKLSFASMFRVAFTSKKKEESTEKRAPRKNKKFEPADFARSLLSQQQKQKFQQQHGQQQPLQTPVLAPLELSAVAAPALPSDASPELVLVFHLAGEALVEFALCQVALAALEKGPSAEASRVDPAAAEQASQGAKQRRRTQRLAALDALRRATQLVPLDRRAAVLLPLGDLLLDLNLYAEAEGCFGDAVVLCAAAAEPPARRAKVAARQQAKAMVKAQRAQQQLVVAQAKEAKDAKTNPLVFFKTNMDRALVALEAAADKLPGAAELKAETKDWSVTQAIQGHPQALLGNSAANKIGKVEDALNLGNDDDDDVDYRSDEDELLNLNDDSVDGGGRDPDAGSLARLAANAGAAAAALALPRAYCGLADALSAQGLHAAAATCFYACIGLRHVSKASAIQVHRRLAKLLLDTPAAAFGGLTLSAKSGGGIGIGRGLGASQKDKSAGIGLDPEEAASRTMSKAVQLAPRDVRLKLELGGVQLRIARFADARRTFRSALSLLQPPRTDATDSTAAKDALATEDFSAEDAMYLEDTDLMAQSADTNAATSGTGAAVASMDSSSSSSSSSSVAEVRGELTGQCLLGLGRAMDGLGYTKDAEALFLRAVALTRKNNDRALAGASLGLARLRQVHRYLNSFLSLCLDEDVYYSESCPFLLPPSHFFIFFSLFLTLSLPY